MFEAENIRDWREHDVIDPDGKKIGQLEAVYVDTGSDEPAFGSVRIGMIGRHRLTFVPLDRAVVLPRQLKVAYPKSQVKSAPTIDPDGELPAVDEPELFKHYGLEYQPGLSGERRLARRLGAAPRRTPQPAPTPAGTCAAPLWADANRVLGAGRRNCQRAQNPATSFLPC